MKRPLRTRRSTASTTVPHPSLAAYSCPGVTIVSSSFQVDPLCSPSQLRLASTATVSGSMMASTSARLYRSSIHPCARSSCSCRRRNTPIQTIWAPSSPKQTRGTCRRRHLYHSSPIPVIGFIGSPPPCHLWPAPGRPARRAPGSGRLPGCSPSMAENGRGRPALLQPVAQLIGPLGAGGVLGHGRRAAALPQDHAHIL